ncbi:beta-lactamase/transpeptidase-like protein [Fusarium tricinctum]|uniref:Beta-lactamase/transpeptidase-like protein n=1 Tax=Fusarium tricinctum TaxID=61284 RepID=A0A8K0S2Z5_9HYPO|nr:beta-lactamase/transpeptidase-like protein [Fusarium tricinctum]
MSELVDRLDQAKAIHALTGICGVASISVGVLHQGKQIYQHSTGLRDVENNLQATPETSYLLASCSKGFLSIAIGILVEEGKLSWDDLISKHIPKFNPVGDPRIGSEATIRSALSHTVGLSRPQIFLLGPNCSIVSKEVEYVGFLNHISTKNDKTGQRFNSWWEYNNLPYGLITLIVERVTGQRYSEFLKKRIIEPLGLESTVVSSAELGPSSNRAHGYAKLDTGEYRKLRSGDTYTRDDHSPLLGVIGLQSSIVDLLKFSATMLEAYSSEKGGVGSLDDSTNPLRQMLEIWGAQWTRPMQDGFDNELAYCMGWYSGYMPTAGLGYMGTNHEVRKQDQKVFNSKYILGRESPRRFFVGHQGNANGYSSAMYIFPETKSAVVALTNGGNLGDAADFTAKIMIQALFNTKPYIDYLKLAQEEANLHRHWHKQLLVDWLAHSDVMQKEADLDDYVGNYVWSNITVNIFKLEETEHLALTINGHQDSRCNLEFYAKDAYSFTPRTRDEWLYKGMMDWEHYFVGNIQFGRDAAGVVNKLNWKYEPDEEPALFQRNKDNEEPNCIFM